MRSFRSRWVAEMTRTSTPQRLVRAQRLNCSLLQHAQQLGLRRQRHLGHLVQQQRPAVRGAETAVAPADRAGEGATLVTEQLRFQQRVRKGGAVDGHERLPAPWPPLVQRPRDQLLAGAALAADQDGGVAGGDGVDPVHQPEHLRRAADDGLVGAVLGQLRARFVQLAQEGPVLGDALDAQGISSMSNGLVR